MKKESTWIPNEVNDSVCATRAVLLLVCLCLWLCMCEWHIFVLSSSTPSTSAHFDMQIEWRIFPMYSDKFINNLYGIDRTNRTDEQPSSNIQCTKIYTMLQWMSSVPENGFIHSLWSFIRSLANIARKKNNEDPNKKWSIIDIDELQIRVLE